MAGVLAEFTEAKISSYVLVGIIQLNRSARISDWASRVDRKHWPSRRRSLPLGSRSSRAPPWQFRALPRT